MKAEWRVTYENGTFLDSFEPQAYHRIQRRRRHVFDLLTPSGGLIESWDVWPQQRLLHASRNLLRQFGPASLQILVGVELRGREELGADVWGYRLAQGKLVLERRSRWARLGEEDFVIWSRPKPPPGDG